MPDIAIPIVFPDYTIAVNTPRARIKIPDLLPGIDILPDDIEIPETRNKVPELGHAGILFINGSTGTTKYFEYGRYGPKGIVRKHTIRNVKYIGEHPEKSSLTYVLSQISIKAGHGGRISGAYIEVPGKYQAMLDRANKRLLENKNPSRKPYDLFSNSCNHFMKQILEAADVSMPYMVDPRPNSYIEEIRAQFNDLDYSRVENTVSLENPPTSLAAINRSFMQPAAA
ncbi:hypothetical protein [Microbulbifer celer]|uniref:Type VI secretion system effector TseH-like domain-containing protein n=1 Tax=Microbulbifer celer TaxID=435905 RepID=A0ABW3U593_9GAMM|nr:hypothetical protein [Microbulbifer celer]UFN56151.1 hypothetical protein LPW13_11250 [Microbulbifer celer]